MSLCLILEARMWKVDNWCLNDHTPERINRSFLMTLVLPNPKAAK